MLERYRKFRRQRAAGGAGEGGHGHGHSDGSPHDPAGSLRQSPSEEGLVSSGGGVGSQSPAASPRDEHQLAAERAADEIGIEMTEMHG